MIPIGGPFVIDPRGIHGIVGAALTGPVGGLMVDVLTGVPAKLPMVGIPSFRVAYFFVGLTVHTLKKYKWIGGLTVLSGHLTAAIIVWIMGLVYSLGMGLILILPRAAAEIPIQIMLLYALFKRWPNCDTLI